MKPIRPVQIVRLLLYSAALWSSAPAWCQSAESAYHYRVPQGWLAMRDGGVETLTPPQTEPAGSAQLLLLAPKPARGELRQQFEQERSALEGHWGLRAPQALQPQGGQVGALSWAAHFASYDSEGGQRYLGFLSLGDGQRFALLVFAASSADHFNRLVPQAIDVYRSLALR